MSPAVYPPGIFNSLDYMNFPTIHLNGTSPSVLRDSNLEAYHKVDDAISFICTMEFHGRDYYPQGEGSFDRAREERNQHLAALRAAASYFMTHAEHASTFCKD